MSDKKALTRADRVRERRRKQRHSKLNEMPVLKPVEPLRPSKTTAFIGPKKRKPAKSAVRTYNLDAIALPQTRQAAPSSSLELEMPSLEWRAVSAFIILLLTIGLYFLWTSPYFRVTVPDVVGSELLSREEIVKTLDLGGTPIFLLKPETIEHELLLSHPSLKTVKVSLSLPNVVHVAVTDRKPLLVWQQDGKMAWIDEEGVAFPVSGRVDGLITVSAFGRPPAPAIDAENRNPWAPPAYLDPSVIAALRALVPYVPQDAAITYAPNTGLGWRDSRGWMVELGDMTEDFGLKLKLYETISNWMIANNIQPVLINVVHPHAPYYRTEP